MRIGFVRKFHFVKNFLREKEIKAAMQWYSEGCVGSPPPCCQFSCIYLCCSKNPLFVTLGRLGTKFGETYRSQIFFISFWISFFSLVLIAVAVCSVSLEPSVVTSVPFFHGKVALTNTSTSVTSELNFYAGLNILVFEDCSDEVGAAVCPPRSQSWGSVECEQYFNHCDECRDSSTGSVTTVLIALVTQFLQIGCDIQRSTAKGDFHFMKFVGIVTGFIGIFSTLSAVNSFGNACLRDLQPSVDYVSVDKEFGAALICLVIATILKVVDIVAHIIVPVPLEGYWEPDVLAANGSQKANQNGVVEVHEFNAVPVSSTMEEEA